jgi:3-hydroxyacyl-CoA dehydrogenase
MTIALDKDTVQYTFRDGVLAALDLIARDVFANVPKAQRNDTGASDADLPELFKSIDAQVERLCARYDIVLVELEDANQ